MREFDVMDKICVIMSTYNGETFLKEQLDSIFAQTGVYVSVVVRDDGSIDNTINQLKEYSHPNKKLHIIEGINVGCKKSFHEAAKYAIQKFPEYKYFAFADQDDYWLPEKLQTGIRRLNEETVSPNLYFCPPTIVDSKLNPLGIQWENNHFLSLGEAYLAQPCAGCTMVFDKRALELFLLADPDDMSLHDSWIYKTVLACGGKIVEDTESYILYRQHGNNVVGTQTQWSKWKRRFRVFTKGNCYRSNQVKQIFNTYNSMMNEESLSITQRLIDYQKKGIKNKIRILCDREYRTKKVLNNILFTISLLFNRF